MAKRPSGTQPMVVVRNIDELVKGVPKADKLLIHFTKAQWTDITEGLKRGRRLPKRGVIFAYTPLPDGDGGIGGGDCISGPCEICMSRPGRTPDDFLGWNAAAGAIRTVHRTYRRHQAIAASSLGGKASIGGWSARVSTARPAVVRST